MTAGTPSDKTAVREDSPCRERLKSLENKSISSMQEALASIRELSAARLEAKMSVSRLAGISRELHELIKVMSVYGCQ